MNRCHHAERISPKIRSRGSSTGSESLNSLRARGNIGIDRFFLAKLWNGGFAPVDIASLVFFRIAFGLLMLRMVQLVWSLDRISQWWLEPSFLFKYPGFSWVQPWPGNGLYIHWIFLGVFALFVTVGFLYRISITLFFLSHTYFFLLDQGRYVNHIYLICLFRFPSGMGGLRRELRFAYHRFTHGAVSSLAAESPGRLLRGGNFSPFKLADLSARHLSLARHRGDDSFSLAKLAAADHFNFSTKRFLARDGARHFASASKTNPDPEFRDTLRRDPNFGTAAPLLLFRWH